VNADRAGRAARLGRILVVEDSPSAQRLMQDILLRLGVELPNLRLAGTAREALTIFTQWRPDLVFVDIELRPGPPAPAMDVPTPSGRPDPRDGVELARLFRTRDPSVTILISSATDPSDPRLVALRSEGPVEALTKPLLASRVEEVLNRISATPRPRST
jgi:CheY-like chemotaxis protein